MQAAVAEASEPGQLARTRGSGRRRWLVPGCPGAGHCRRAVSITRG